MPKSKYPVATYNLRLRKLYERATEDEIMEGLSWYARAAWELLGIARESGYTFETVCGVCAVLSPQVRWSHNVIATRSCLQGEHSGSAYPANWAKAEAIRDGASPDIILGGTKVRAFYRCLVSQGSDAEALCLDSVAFLAALGADPKTATTQDTKTVFNRPAQQAAIGLAYRQLARREGILPSQAQAVVWIVYRNLRDQSERVSA